MELIGWLVSALLFFVPLYRILPRTGMDKNFAFFAFIPLGGLVLLWVIAFRDWTPGTVHRDGTL
jgi:hypothetical protein